MTEKEILHQQTNKSFKGISNKKAKKKKNSKCIKKALSY